MSNLTTIDFHGAKLIAVPGDKPETTLVAMKPIVEGIGLDWSRQLKKLKEHPVFGKGMGEMTIPSSGGPQTMVAIPLNRLHGWLMTIQPNKVPDEIVRGRVIDFQTEAADVIFNHFFGKAIASGSHLTAREVGGIAKGVVNKALAPMQEQIAAIAEGMKQIATGYDPTASFTTDFRPMLSVLIEYKVPSKGRRALSTRCSTLCTRFLQKNDMGGMIRISRETGRRVFKEEGVKKWLAAGGAEIIMAARDAALGQSVIKFPDGTQPKGGRSK